VAVGSGGPSEEGSTGLQNFILFYRFYRYRFNVLRIRSRVHTVPFVFVPSILRDIMLVSGR
jgi:hypothetical protein